MKTISTRKQPTERVPTFIRPTAHTALPKLCEMLAQEKGMGVSFTDAISIAIYEAVQKREKQAKKQEQS